MKPLFLDLPGVISVIGVSESTVQKMVRMDQFPKPRLMSNRRVGWLVREIEEWAESRPIADLLPPVNCQVGRGGAPAS
jgi:prophage regulatory protein